FVTFRGELVEADGTMTAGAYCAEAGLISRKSELRELRQKQGELIIRYALVEEELSRGTELCDDLNAQFRTVRREIDVVPEQAGDLKSRTLHHRHRREGLNEEVSLSRSEICGLKKEIEKLTTDWQTALDRAAVAEHSAQSIQAQCEQREKA